MKAYVFAQNKAQESESGVNASRAGSSNDGAKIEEVEIEDEIDSGNVEQTPERELGQE